MLAACARQEPTAVPTVDVAASGTPTAEKPSTDKLSADSAPASAVPAGPLEDFSPFEKVDETDPAALEIPREGATAPLLIIVEFGAYECPHTRRAEAAVSRLVRETPEVARFFVHNPLEGHKKGYLLALAASAAQRQGRFWQMHTLLMEAPLDIDEDRLLSLARKAEIDIPTFLKDIKRDEIKQHVERNRTLTAALSLTGTPVFLVNGRVVLGWPGEEKIDALVKKELEGARSSLAARLSPDRLARTEPRGERGAGGRSSSRALHQEMAARHPPYRVVIEKGVKWDAPPVMEEGGESDRFKVTLDNAAGTVGWPRALVTVVEFIDLTCPHSAKAFRQVLELAPKYGNDVRFLFKLVPSRARAGSEAAAVAAWAAGKAGRFSEFASAFFESGLEAANAAACASGCLTVESVHAEFEESLDAVRIEAVLVSAIGTPAIYVNGIRRMGFQETGEFARLLDQEVAVAHALEEKGVKITEIHAMLTAQGRHARLLGPPSTPVACAECPHLGTGHASCRMLVAWDFASPFCRNLWPYLKQLHARFGTTLAIHILPVVKSDDDPSRLLAATAACAWGLGAYEPMQHALFAHKGNWDIEAFAALAEQSGMDPITFRQCVESQPTNELVERLAALNVQAGSPGAPTVFLNDRKVEIPSGLDYHSLAAAVLSVP